VTPGADAFALADQFNTVPFNVPVAVPATFRSPAHDALNDPFAELEVCSVTFHLKSVHEAAAGITLAEADVQLPISALTPAPVGLVIVLFD
jgi:hypothetical protein